MNDLNAQPTPLRLTRNERGQLAAHLGDAAPIDNARIARCFPWSNRDEYLSVRDADGKEVHLLRTLGNLDADTRALIDEELSMQEFFPRITAVLSAEQRFDVTLWHIETDRGPAELRVKDSEDIRHIDDQRVLVKDAAGGIYEIPDINALDPRSRKLIDERLG